MSLDSRPFYARPQSKLSPALTQNSLIIPNLAKENYFFRRQGFFENVVPEQNGGRGQETTYRVVLINSNIFLSVFP